MITLNIKLNISTSQGHQAIKFGQLKKYSVKNTFLQNSCRKWGREASSRPHFVFLKSFIEGQTLRSISSF